MSDCENRELATVAIGGFLSPPTYSECTPGRLAFRTAPSFIPGRRIFVNVLLTGTDGRVIEQPRTILDTGGPISCLSTRFLGKPNGVKVLERCGTMPFGFTGESKQEKKRRQVGIIECRFLCREARKRTKPFLLPCVFVDGNLLEETEFIMGIWGALANDYRCIRNDRGRMASADAFGCGALSWKIEVASEPRAVAGKVKLVLPRNLLEDVAEEEWPR